MRARACAAVRGLADGLRRRQGINRPVIGHAYGGAAGKVSLAGGVVRLRASPPRLRNRRRSGRLDGGEDEVTAQVCRQLVLLPLLLLLVVLFNQAVRTRLL